MSNVMLSIGGRSFSVACADGEEAHIATLGSAIDAKVRSLGDTAGQNEVRMLLYAALVLADDLHEAASAAPVAATPANAASALQNDSGLTTRLERIAGTLENLATHLEREAS